MFISGDTPEKKKSYYKLMVGFFVALNQKHGIVI